MATSTFGSQELNQRPGSVTKAVDRDGEAIITKRGVPTYRITRIDHSDVSASLWQIMSGLARTDAEVDFPSLDGELEDPEEYRE